MTTYQLTALEFVIKDGTTPVPTNPGLLRPETQDYYTWLAAGNTPLPMDAANAAIVALKQADAAADTVAKANPVINYLVNHTPAECISKVNTDVVDLATAKTMLGNFAVALCVLARNQLR